MRLSRFPTLPYHSVRVAIGLCVLLPAAAAWSTDVQVFTDRQHPVSATAGARVVELDTPTRLEAELAAHLSADPGRAAAIVRQRLERGGSELQQRMAAFYQGVADAWGLGVITIPAVVVDRRYVVYGESDVARAVARIEAHRSGRP